VLTSSGFAETARPFSPPGRGLLFTVLNQAIYQTLQGEGFKLLNGVGPAEGDRNIKYG
jgi:hypothetical protein